MPTTWSGTVHRQVEATGWPVRLAISAGFAGLIALFAAISFPVSWTPVPFSLAPIALLLTGTYQRPGYAALSVVIYLMAAGLGMPIFAEGESGFHHFIGNTAGYLFGFIAVSSMVSWYMQERRRLLPRRWITIMLAGIGALVIGGIVAIIRFTGSGAGFSAYGEEYIAYGMGRSVLWVMVFLVAASTGLGIWAMQRARGQGTHALNLFLVMIAATGVLHFMGVSGLVWIAGLDVVTAIVLGSIVFLPFDILKAALAVALSLPFLPAPAPAPQAEESHA